MGERLKCPVKGCGRPAKRVYSQVTKRRLMGARKGTSFATNVNLPFVYCGTPSVRKGKGMIVVGSKGHGMVPLKGGIVTVAFPQARAKAAPKGQRPRIVHAHPRTTESASTGAGGAPSEA